MPQHLTYHKSTLVKVMAWCHQATTITWANVDKINDISCKISMSITMKSALFFFSYRYCCIPMNGFGCNDDYSITIHIDGLVQERCNFSALAMELRLSCTNPSIWSHTDIISLKTHWNDVLYFQEKFASLSLAFKTDKLTLEQRIEIHERSRDRAEQNIDKELDSLKNAMQVSTKSLLPILLKMLIQDWQNCP